MIDQNVEAVLSTLDVQLQAQAAANLGQAIDVFSAQNNQLANAVAFGANAAIAEAALSHNQQFIGPGVVTTPDPRYNAATYANDFANTTSTLDQLPSSYNAGGIAGNLGGGGASRSWESIKYGDDWIPHQPKFKFLFKVKFEGQGNSSFFYYVKSSDKPKVRFEHQEVNYYNFRTKVMTRATFDPLTLTFWDEIGNSVNDFFVEYLNRHSGQGAGKADIDEGFGIASSTKPYPTGYSFLKRVTIEQVFANGVASNRFYLWNPRIESFDFDPMDMEDNGGSMVNITFNYDAISCETVGYSTIHRWGNTDLLSAGGGGGAGGGGSGASMSPSSVHGRGGSGIGGAGSFVGANRGMTRSSSSNDSLPLAAINDLINPVIATLLASEKGVISSNETTISRSVQDTLAATASTFANPNFSPSSNNSGPVNEREVTQPDWQP